MWLLFVEAGIAVFLLIFIVWWTMLHGKKPMQPPARKTADKDTTDSTQD